MPATAKVMPPVQPVPPPRRTIWPEPQTGRGVRLRTESAPAANRLADHSHAEADRGLDLARERHRRVDEWVRNLTITGASLMVPPTPPIAQDAPVIAGDPGPAPCDQPPAERTTLCTSRSLARTLHRLNAPRQHTELSRSTPPARSFSVHGSESSDGIEEIPMKYSSCARRPKNKEVSAKGSLPSKKDPHLQTANTRREQQLTPRAPKIAIPPRGAPPEAREIPHASLKGPGAHHAEHRLCPSGREDKLGTPLHQLPPNTLAQDPPSTSHHPYKGPAVLPTEQNHHRNPHERRQAQRFKQLSHGKNTAGYQNYRSLILKTQRLLGLPAHPVTPRVDSTASKRMWDRELGLWRRALHAWDDECITTVNRTGRGNAPLSQGDIEANPGPSQGPSSVSDWDLGDDLSMVAPTLANTWHRIPQALVLSGPAGEQTTRATAMFVHGTPSCRQALVPRSVQDFFRHQCPLKHSNERVSFECPTCEGLVTSTPRGFKRHFFECLDDLDSDGEGHGSHQESSRNRLPWAPPPARIPRTALEGPWRPTPFPVKPSRQTSLLQLWRHMRHGRGSDLLTMGDIESNPGPPDAHETNPPTLHRHHPYQAQHRQFTLSTLHCKPQRTPLHKSTITNLPNGSDIHHHATAVRDDKDDWMLDPPLFCHVVRTLSANNPPRIDAFANTNNAQLKEYWSATNDAFTYPWTGPHPIWANPPFHMLPRILAHIKWHGAFILLTAPSWSPALPGLVAIATSTLLLPDQPLYRIRGAKLLPRPNWRTLAMLINTQGHPSATLHDTPRTTLADILDSTDRQEPPYILKSDWCAHSTPLLFLVRERTYTVHEYGGRTFYRIGEDIYDTRGPSPLLCSTCRLWQWPWECPSLLPVHSAAPPWSAKARPTFRLKKTTRQLPFASNVAKLAPTNVRHSIPLFSENDSHIPRTGRGHTLLSQGDVEANPGPTGHSECPFGQPCAMQARGLETIKAHVQTVHLSAGQIPPGEWLRTHGLWVCARCLVLVKGRTCAHPSCYPAAFMPHSYTVQRPAGTAGPQSFPHQPTAQAEVTTTLDMPEPLQGPSLKEILSTPIATFDRIPSKARRAVSESFHNCLIDLLINPSWQKLRAFMAWPKIVLRAPGPEGKGQLNQNVNTILDNIEHFHSQPLHHAWQPPVFTNKRRTRSSTKKDRIDDRLRLKIKRLVADGLAGQAMKLLMSSGAHDMSDPRVLQCLKDMHPSEGPIRRLPTPPEHAITFAQEHDAKEERHHNIRKCIRAFNYTSAPGPSGLKAAHLKDMLQTKQQTAQTSLLTSLDLLISTALQGKLHQRIATSLGAAKLTAIRKDKTPESCDVDHTAEGDIGEELEHVPSKKTIRPIAVGETIRRLIGKVALSLPQSKNAVQRLLPIQHGVGAKRGAEHNAMLIQESTAILNEHDDSTDWCLLKVDLSNAFNAVSRQKMLLQVAQKAPHLLPWTQSLYGEDLTLYIGQNTIPSQRGVQQGCNFGTFLFALAIQPILEQLQGLWLNRWYADDGLLLGPMTAVNACLKYLCTSMSDIGLDVNLNKCEIWGPGSTMAMDHMDDLALKKCHPIPWTPDSGTVILGTPVHHPSPQGVGNNFMQEWWKQKTTLMATTIDRITSFGDAHVQHLLLSTCLTTNKVEHALRASDSRGCTKALHDIRSTLLDGIQRTLNCTMDEDQATQAFLPAREGGMGYRDPCITWAGSRLAASAAFMRDLTSDHDLHAILNPLDNTTPMGTTEAIAQLQQSSIVGQVRLQSWANDTSALKEADPTVTSSALWNARQHSSKAKAWKEEGTSRDRIRKSLLQPTSMQWCSTPPGAARSTLFGHQEFRLSCKYYMGIAIMDQQHAGSPCPKCSRPLDIWGDHAVSCSLNGSTERHYQLRDKLAELAHRAGMAVTKEEALPDGDRPADLLIKRWDAQGTAAIDITCTHPLRSSDNNTTPEQADKSLQTAQQAKITKYKERCSAIGWNFIPAVCHTFGGWHGTAKGVIRRLILRVTKEEAEGEDTPPPQIAAELSYLSAHLTGGQLAITLDAGYHSDVAPKRTRLDLTAVEYGGQKRGRCSTT